MITRKQQQEAIQRAWDILSKSGIAIRHDERAHIDVADFGLGELDQTGLQILPLVITDKISIKLLVLQPWQVCPQHRHPPQGDYPGKEETVRGQWGAVYLCVPGEPPRSPLGHPPEHRRAYYSVWHEVALRPGEQYTVPPNTWHWFQGGPEGGVVWSMCSRATDEQDLFTDPQVVRRTVVRGT